MFYHFFYVVKAAFLIFSVFWLIFFMQLGNRSALNDDNENFGWRSIKNSRKDLSLKDCKIDILLITGMLSPYSSVVEKLHRDVNKERVTMLKVERAGDVLVDAVSLTYKLYTFTIYIYIYRERLKLESDVELN